MWCIFPKPGPPWICNVCHTTHARHNGEPILSAKSPRRDCQNSPDLNTPEHRARVKETTLAELEPMALKSDLPSIAAQLDQCLELCDRFNGRTCTARGSSCRLLTRWLEFLALMTGPCNRFKPSQPEFLVCAGSTCRA